MAGTDTIAAAFSFTYGKTHTQSTWGDARSVSWPDLVEMLTSHLPGIKEGPCIVPAVFTGTSRKKEEAAQIDVAFLDSDSGATLDDITAAIKAKGWEAVVSSTHSHMTTQTQVSLTNWDRYFAKAPSATAADFLRDEKSYLPHVFEGAEVIKTDDSHIFLEHGPCPKFRIALPLKRPWRAADYPTQAAANDAWRERIEALAAALSLPHDQACTDTSRLFYLPRRPPNGAVPETAVVAGAYCDLFGLPGVAAPDLLTTAPRNTTRAATGPEPHEYMDPITGEFVDLTSWAKANGRTFLIAKALKARKPGVFTSLIVDNCKVHIDCPNHAAHTTPGRDNATFVVNAGNAGTEGFVVHCRHAHCTGKDRLFFVGRMLEEGWLSIDDLTAKEFHGKAETPAPQAPPIQPAIELPRDDDGEIIFPVEFFADIQPVTHAQDFVEGLLVEETMSVIYGESNSGKTFFATDLAFHIAKAEEWNGREVDRGAVLYCALEGGHGIRNRIAALRQHHGMNGQQLPLAVIPVAINMLDPGQDIDTVIRTIRHVKKRLGLAVKITIMDTLSRAMAGGNENAPDDMGALVTNGTRIQQETKSHLCWIHHSGKDQAKGARGHSLLRAATDTEIEITAEGPQRMARVTKQRDLECSGEFAFTLKVVELGENHRKKPITSCVVDYGGGRPIQPAGGRRLSGHQQRAVEILQNTIISAGRSGDAGVPSGCSSVPEKWWRDRFYDGAMPGAEPDTKQKAFRRASMELISSRIVGMAGGRVWLVSKRDAQPDISSTGDLSGPNGVGDGSHEPDIE